MKVSSNRTDTDTFDKDAQFMKEKLEKWIKEERARSEIKKNRAMPANLHEYMY